MLVKLKRVKGGLWSIKALNGVHSGRIIGTATSMHLKGGRFGSSCVTGTVVTSKGLRLLRELIGSETEKNLKEFDGEHPTPREVAARITEPLGWVPTNYDNAGGSLDPRGLLRLVGDLVVDTEVRYDPLPKYEATDKYRPTQKAHVSVMGKIKSFVTGS